MDADFKSTQVHTNSEIESIVSDEFLGAVIKRTSQDQLFSLLVNEYINVTTTDSKYVFGKLWAVVPTDNNVMLIVKERGDRGQVVIVPWHSIINVQINPNIIEKMPVFKDVISQCSSAFNNEALKES
jgi:selenophosphate synthase